MLMDRNKARDILNRVNPEPRQDFYALSHGQVEQLMAEAKAHRYKVDKNASGSKARYFHEYLRRRADSRAAKRELKAL